MGHFSKVLERAKEDRKGSQEPSDIKTQDPPPTISEPNIESWDGQLIALSDPWSYSAEQFRSIKTAIMFPEGGRELRTILVTSAVPGEGKSFVASNVAASIASSMDNYVLLIDSDLRRPTISGIFGLPDGISGMNRYLNKQCELKDVIYKTHIEKLSVIPAGDRVENPSELITSTTMTQMIAEVKNRYTDRYVIIDSPPPLCAPETIVVSKHVDGIVVVVRNDCTQKKSIDQMLDKLDRSKIIGVVLNRYDAPSVTDYGRKSYYGYGKKS